MFSDLVAALAAAGAALEKDASALDEADRRALASVKALSAAFAAAPAGERPGEDARWAEFESAAARERALARQARGK